MLGSMPASGGFRANGSHSSHMQQTLSGYQPPETPDHLKPFRRSGNGEPGTHVSHYAKGTPFIVPNQRFGRSNKYDESTATRFAEMREPIFSLKTRAYASEAKEPLGHSMSYGFHLPTHVNNPDFRFGVKSTRNEGANSVIYPAEGPGATDPAKEASAQTQRNYDWGAAKIDPTDFRFGVPSKKTVNDSVFPTQVVPASDAEHRRLRHGEIGSPRATGCAPILPPNHTYGMTNAGQSCTMKEALSQANSLTPVDLGTTSIKSPTLRRMKAADLEASASNPGSPSKVFGVPSIRSDKPPPKIPKITGNINFGDELNANQLLFPTADISGAATKVLASVDDAEVLANRCKFGLNREEVGRAYSFAGRKGQTVTAASFKKAIDDLGL